MAPPPPFIRCLGVRNPSAKAINGVYEFHGICDGRPVYHQTGVSSGNHIWFSEDEEEHPCWYVTPRDQKIGVKPEAVVAKSVHAAWWPWEVDGWHVCGKSGKFVPAPAMHFSLVLPSTEIMAHLDAPHSRRRSGLTFAGFPDGRAQLRLQGAGEVNGRPMYRSSEESLIKLFWMPKMSRWLLASTRPARDGGGVCSIIARSLPDDGSTWVSHWPWEDTHWELPSVPTLGLDDVDTTWQAANKRFRLELTSPPITISGDPEVVPESLLGFYEPKGMLNSRVFYMQRQEDFELGSSLGPKALWYAEDRGQWVVTDPTSMGCSDVVAARVNSHAWWPWEAHLGGTTAPSTLGSAPFAQLPPWFGGAAVLAASRSKWEVAEPSGSFYQARDMRVGMVSQDLVIVKGMETAEYDFLGVYTKMGLVSSRPFYLQRPKPRKDDRGEATQRAPAEQNDEDEPDCEVEILAPECQYVIWFSDELEQWLITEDFRFLSGIAVDARSHDTAWFPYEVSGGWFVSDGESGFVQDVNLVVEVFDPSTELELLEESSEELAAERRQ